MTDSSRSNGTNASRIDGTSPTARQASSSNSGLRSTACPLPSYPSRRVFSTAGRPTASTATASDGRSSTAANVGTGSPTSVKSVFSAIRSCAASSATGGGRTAGPRMPRTVSTDTFSNSYVTTSTSAVSRAIASGSS